MSLEGACHKLDSRFHYKLTSNLEGASWDLKFLEKSTVQIEHKNVVSLERSLSLTKNLPSGVAVMISEIYQRW